MEAACTAIYIFNQYLTTQNENFDWKAVLFCRILIAQGTKYQIDSFLSRLAGYDMFKLPSLSFVMNNFDRPQLQ